MAGGSHPPVATHPSSRPGAGGPLVARPFAQEPALSGAEGVEFHRSLPTWDLLEPHDRKSGDYPSLPVFRQLSHDLALSGSPAGYLRDKPSECPWSTKYSELRGRCMVSDGLHENRTILTAIRHQPTPEVGTLARSQDCSPSTANEREVQKNDRVRRSKPNLNNVRGPQITIHNPSFFRDKPLLHDHPLIARCCGQTWSPEDLVKLDHRKAGDLAQASR